MAPAVALREATISPVLHTSGSEIMLANATPWRPSHTVQAMPPTSKTNLGAILALTTTEIAALMNSAPTLISNHSSLASASRPTLDGMKERAATKMTIAQ